MPLPDGGAGYALTPVSYTHLKMETTITRAKEIKPMAEKMITLGKKADLAAYRQAMSFIRCV